MSARTNFRSAILGVITLSLVASAQSAHAEFPYTGEVTGTSSSVNIRSGPSTNFYPVIRLAPGDRVTIVGEESGWYAIEPTPGCYSLISKHYVDIGAGGEGVVNGNSVRVRAGSDIDKHRYAVQRKLDKGAVLRIIGEDEDGFLKIEPPKGARLWIHADYVERVPDDRLANEATHSAVIAQAEPVSDRQPQFEQDADDDADDAVIEEAPAIATPVFNPPVTRVPEPAVAVVDDVEDAGSEVENTNYRATPDSRMVASAIEEARSTDRAIDPEPIEVAEVEVVEPQVTQVARWGDDSEDTQVDAEPYITNVEPVDRLHAAVRQNNAGNTVSRDWETTIATNSDNATDSTEEVMPMMEEVTPVVATNDSSRRSSYIAPPTTSVRSSTRTAQPMTMQPAVTQPTITQPSSMYAESPKVQIIEPTDAVIRTTDPRDGSIGYAEAIEVMEPISDPAPAYRQNRQVASGQSTATTQTSVYSKPVTTSNPSVPLVEPIEPAYVDNSTGDPHERVNDAVDRLALAARQRSPQYQTQSDTTSAKPNVMALAPQGSASSSRNIQAVEMEQMEPETISTSRDSGNAYGVTYADGSTSQTSQPAVAYEGPFADASAPIEVERAPEPDLDAYLFKGGDEREHLAMLDERFEKEMTKPVEDRFFGALVKAYEELSKIGTDQVVRLYSERRLSQVQLAEATADAIRDIRSLNTEVGRHRRLALEERSQMVPPPRLVTRGFDAKGELRKSMIFSSPVGPKRYRLVDPEMVVPRTMCYVEVPAELNIDIDQYLGRLVGIRASRKYLETGNVDPINVIVAEEFVVLDPSNANAQASATSGGLRTSNSGLVAVVPVDTRD